MPCQFSLRILIVWKTKIKILAHFLQDILFIDTSNFYFPKIFRTFSSSVEKVLENISWKYFFKIFCLISRHLPSHSLPRLIPHRLASSFPLIFFHNLFIFCILYNPLLLYILYLIYSTFIIYFSRIHTMVKYTSSYHTHILSY